MPNYPSGGPNGMPDGGAQMPDPMSDGGSPGRRVGERRKQYLVAPRPAVAPAPFPLAPFALAPFVAGQPPGPPLTLQAVEHALRAAPDIEVVRTVGAGNVGLMSTGPDASSGVLVARMTDDKASELLRQTQGRLLVERDHHLQLLDPVPRASALVDSFSLLDAPAFDVTVRVLDKDGMGVPDADVSLFGGLAPASAVTDGYGQAIVTVRGSPQSLTGLYVKPRFDYWTYYQTDPDLDVTQANLVTVHALSEWPSLPGFPSRSAMGWGARAMRLDQLPPSFRGQGVKVAIIDSGAATTHANLNRIRSGVDIVNDNTATWTQDVLGHGSHCAGVIAATDPSFGIRGFAPEAEVHVCRLFPGGQISQLIEALEYCIDHQIDVVNLSLGGAGPSAALEQQIVRAKRAGVACIVAAGNSGGPVQYPGASPNVLAVSAVGKIDEFPRDSYHTQTVGQDIDAQGYFTASFSCSGPQVGVCAPGVAIVSSVPPNNFAAWDGTSMAAPHVTGLAALMLAHHPEFQSQARMRSAERVERLFQLIRASARPVSRGDPTRIGYGMPDAVVALGLGVSPAAGPGIGPGRQATASMPGALFGMPGGAMAMQAGGRGAFAGAPGMAGAAGGGQAGGFAPFGFGLGNLPPQGW